MCLLGPCHALWLEIGTERVQGHQATAPGAFVPHAVAKSG